MRVFIGSFLLLSLLVPFVVHAAPSEAIIFYNEVCSDCAVYINEQLIPLLKELGVQKIVRKDFINDRRIRQELNELSQRLGVPPKLQGHFTIFIDERVILQGHVPEHIIRDLFKDEKQRLFDKIVVYQDRMEGMGEEAVSYKVWAFQGDIKEYPIDTPISEYLNWFAANKDNLPSEPAAELWDFKRFLPLILTTGLLDGINPCAFAVLLFFIAFLFTIHRTKLDILKVGVVYIVMIYLTYLGIGLGILKAFVLSGSPHFMAKLGSGLVIFLGLVNIKDYFWYGRWFSLSVPKVGQETRDRWMRKATLPATIVLGFLVGICEFPCTGGIYVATLGLLSAKTTFLLGFSYLLLYNLMFVLPLIVILLAIGNRRALGRLSRWEASNKRELKLATGLVMILLGASILIWFV